MVDSEDVWDIVKTIFSTCIFFIILIVLTLLVSNNSISFNDRAISDTKHIILNQTNYSCQPVNTMTANELFSGWDLSYNKGHFLTYLFVFLVIGSIQLFAVLLFRGYIPICGCGCK